MGRTKVVALNRNGVRRNIGLPLAWLDLLDLRDEKKVTITLEDDHLIIRRCAEEALEEPVLFVK